MTDIDREVQQITAWSNSARFERTERLYSPRQVVEQRGTIPVDYPVARDAAEGFYARLRELFSQGKSITTFGPYSPGQAVAMKRAGIEGIYLGGWATSAKGSIKEDPGADLASYPLSAVPEEAAPLVRALLAADRNQLFAHSRMMPAAREKAALVDFRPFIIADADTGHGGEAHVRNLVRRFVEVGVPGYHIEDQKPGAKKCGHQGGKVLVPVAEQIKRLNAARFQLDVMGVPGIIVARTDAEAATLLDGRFDERDQPFILGATNVNLPSLKIISLAILKWVHDMGVDEVVGHKLYRVSDDQWDAAAKWLDRVGLRPFIANHVEAFHSGAVPTIDTTLNAIKNRVLDAWAAEATLKTYGEAVADVMAFRRDEGAELNMTTAEWNTFVQTASFADAKAKARSMGISIIWSADHCTTPEGYFQIRGGMPYAIARSQAVAPYCDIIWMETKTANLPDAAAFAEAIHAVYPDQMLAYNLSPSFSWDTTGMNDDEMREFPIGLGKLGYVFNFITYGGHQVDGLAGEEFAASLQQDGMLALARLQRKFRMVDSPYKTPQTLVGGPRIDACLMATSGHTAATKAMGKGSTQFQHLVHIEVPVRLLEEWLDIWRDVNGIDLQMRVKLRPHRANWELLELVLLDDEDNSVAFVTFAPITDRQDRCILSVRNQNMHPELRRKRLMTLMQLFLMHRYKADSLHYVSPTDDNHRQTERMRDLGLFDDVRTDVGQIIVANVHQPRVGELVGPNWTELKKLISKSA